MTSTTAKCATSLGGASPARRIARRALLDVPPLLAASPTYRLGFGLFVLVNAVLFVRPAELIPGIADWPIYEVVILACLLASLPAVIRQLTWNSLRRNPITLCVVGLLLAIILSHLTHGDIYDARMGAEAFLKVVIYYLLLVGLVNTPGRLRLFLLIVTGFVLCTTILTLLNHHGVIDVAALSEYREAYGEDADTGDVNFISRLRAMGIFNDPNDFALILNVAMFLCLHWLIEQKKWVFRLAWALPIATLVYALTLTQSRGGFLSLLAGLVVMLFTRLHWKRAVVICVVLLPAMLLAFGGRLTDFNDDPDDTAQGRVQLWRDSVVLFHQMPVFGNGYETLADEIGLVAHNSYIHSYAELGFFGGTLFVGAFYLALIGIGRIHRTKVSHVGSELYSMRLCLFPMVVAYAIGLYSLSRTYANSTYIILGIAAAFLGMGAARRLAVPALTARLVGQLAAISLAALFFFEVVVRLLGQ